MRTVILYQLNDAPDTDDAAANGTFWATERHFYFILKSFVSLKFVLCKPDSEMKLIKQKKWRRER